MHVRQLGPGDHDWLERVLREETAGPDIVSRGRMHNGLALPGHVAEHDGERAGVALHRIDGDGCELVFIAATMADRGVGTALLERLVAVASAQGCRRAWVITTNDNTAALRFYQRQGWNLIAVHRDAVTEARRLKRAIPEVGRDAIPIRHELELELRI
jgi:N-acetylglutamate synthase-like GNAT family acetyltransferase